MRHFKEVAELEEQLAVLEARSATATAEERVTLVQDIERVSRALAVARESTREIFTGAVLSAGAAAPIIRPVTD